MTGSLLNGLQSRREPDASEHRHSIDGFSNVFFDAENWVTEEALAELLLHSPDKSATRPDKGRNSQNPQ